ncbi:dTDP-4-dehydrorhamnose reductase [Flavobacterium sp. MK4S-17]|uniref:dTDP-4-dehydrorhamnose reductase n=1 Tax=Flavobacterium sp. MK4S-17 TaxID=2543737 RepID=UPI00135CA0A4|nr:dTDP-4-dehydrorhamnose reductase [Flavobacterium sp. MK4S-17]
MVKVLVTGADGQLGQAIKSVAGNYNSFIIYYAARTEADITNIDQIEKLFEKIKPDYCINTAAYTAVDRAEVEADKAYAVNAVGAGNIAAICKKHNTVLLHISTDFVFDGLNTTPYKEMDVPNPLNVYGKTKLDGEIKIAAEMRNYYIIRTSWLYSDFGNNFMKTMLRLAHEKNEINVVNDQTGTPTNAIDLAFVLLHIITHDNSKFGIYNFSNEGKASWYDFAKKIFEINEINIALHPIPASSYPTPAKRPAYSVLDKNKIINNFGIKINDWAQSLKPIKII